MPIPKAQHVSLLLALLCSLLTGAAQLVVKWGAECLRGHGWLDPSALLLVFLSYVLLGAALVVFLLALRGGALSTVYPVLAARYVWVVVLTPLLFTSESLNFYKLAGAVLVAGGVALVARAGAR